MGSGRRSCLFGGFGSANLVRRTGGSSRGGRLKSMLAPSSPGCRAASGGSYGAMPNSESPIAMSWPGRHVAVWASGSRSTVACTPGCGVTWQAPPESTLTCRASGGTDRSPTLMLVTSPLPMSASPRLIRCTPPAPGPPTTRISTKPVGSGGRHPEGSPRLTTAPFLIGELASVSCGPTSWKST
jgi:hypothetical protein